MTPILIALRELHYAVGLAIMVGGPLGWLLLPLHWALKPTTWLADRVAPEQGGPA